MSMLVETSASVPLRVLDTSANYDDVTPAAPAATAPATAAADSAKAQASVPAPAPGGAFAPAPADLSCRFKAMGNRISMKVWTDAATQRHRAEVEYLGDGEGPTTYDNVRKFTMSRDQVRNDESVKYFL